jgi:regulator of nonsense transcripts 2
MMAESLESRKFERKQLFDVPLPVRSRNREPSMSTGSGETEQRSGTMAFSLMTKRGNRQQVYSFIHHGYLSYP